MSALHVANIGGETDAALTDVATTFSSPALAALDAIASPDYLWICVDPDGIGGEPEWMKVTAYTAAAATCTVERAQQGSTARAHASGVEWVHTLAPSEAELLSLMSTGAGTPEGAVTATVGSLFLRSDGGASTTLYVKESGTGNTGWVAK